MKEQNEPKTTPKLSPAIIAGNLHNMAIAVGRGEIADDLHTLADAVYELHRDQEVIRDLVEEVKSQISFMEKFIFIPGFNQDKRAPEARLRYLSIQSTIARVEGVGHEE